MPRRTSAHEKGSWTAEVLRRMRAHCFSGVERKAADSMELGRKIADETPTRKVRMPSMMKIHCCSLEGCNSNGDQHDLLSSLQDHLQGQWR